MQAGTSTGRGVNDTCDVVTGRFGRPMCPDIRAVTPAIIAEGIVDGQPALRLRRAVADAAARTGQLHRAEGGRPRQRHLPLAAQRPARQPPRWPPTARSRTANYQMTPAQFLAATGVPLRRVWPQNVDLLAAGRALRRARQRRRHAVREGAARSARTRANVGMDLYNLFNANTPTTYETGVRPGHQRRALVPAHGRPHARAARFNVQLDF